MNFWILTVIAAGIALYVAIVAMFGFEGFVAQSIAFGRVVFATAVLIIYMPTIAVIFREVPPPRRDYLLAGIIATWASALCFALWNAAGQIFGATTSIFISPIAGFFSLLLVVGGLFHFLAPGIGPTRRAVMAVLIGIVVGILVNGVAPIFFK